VIYRVILIMSMFNIAAAGAMVLASAQDGDVVRVIFYFLLFALGVQTFLYARDALWP